MRLIDADALKNAIRAESWKEDNTVKMAVDYIYIIIDEQPTINPDDCRPHGRWEYDSYGGGTITGTDAPLSYKCTVCGEYAVLADTYCANGGARMIAEDTNVLTKTDMDRKEQGE